MLEYKGICQAHSLLYEAYAMSLVASRRLVEAHEVFQLGISRLRPYFLPSYFLLFLKMFFTCGSRNAKPFDRLKKLHGMFLDEVAAVAQQKAAPDSKVSLCLFSLESSITSTEILATEKLFC